MDLGLSPFRTVSDDHADKPKQPLLIKVEIAKWGLPLDSMKNIFENLI